MDDYIDSIARGDTEINTNASARPTNCCEYTRERDGATRHVFQLFCECNEVDASLEDLLTSGKMPSQSRCRRLEMDISDRIRIPWINGAIKLNIWFFLIPLLFTVEYYLAYLSSSPFLTSYFVNGSVVWLSVIAMKTKDSAQSKLHLYFTAYGILQVMYSYHHIKYYQHDTINDHVKHYFYMNIFRDFSLFSIVLLSFFSLQYIDPGTLPSMTPPKTNGKKALALYYMKHFNQRAKYCQIAQCGIAHYDHYCIWVNKPIGRDNKRWFLLFCLSMSMCGAIFWKDVYSGEHNNLRYGWHDAAVVNGHIYLILVSTRSFFGFVATLMLLVRQMYLISIGLTTYENRYFYDLTEIGFKRRHTTCLENWKLFLTGNEQGNGKIEHRSFEDRKV